MSVFFSSLLYRWMDWGRRKARTVASRWKGRNGEAFFMCGKRKWRKWRQSSGRLFFIRTLSAIYCSSTSFPTFMLENILRKSITVQWNIEYAEGAAGDGNCEPDSPRLPKCAYLQRGRFSESGPGLINLASHFPSGERGRAPSSPSPPSHQGAAPPVR